MCPPDADVARLATRPGWACDTVLLGASAPGAESVGVQVWQVSTTEGAEDGGLLESLDADERSRAARFRFDRDRRLYATARAALRAVTAAHLGLSPREIRFRVSARGKPSLAAPFSDSGLQFNCAHSGALVLLAIARERSVGVDVERTTSVSRIESVVDSFLAPSERRTLDSLGPGDRSRWLFAVWTRKEAALKAVGVGLALAPTSLEAGPLGGVQSLRVDLPDGDGTRRVLVSDVPCAAEYAAAVAVADECPEGRP